MFLLLTPVEQLDELRKQLEKERDLKCEEAAKEFNNVKLEVESRRHDLEASQRLNLLFWRYFESPFSCVLSYLI